MAWHQVNVAFPDSLYQKFVRLVPPGQRTKFLTELAEAGLQQMKFRKALDETYGSWSREAHPELRGGAAYYLRKQRRGRKISH